MKTGDWDRYFMAALSVLILALGATSILDKSPTFDEPYYVGFGLYLLEKLPERPLATIPVFAHPPLSYYVSSAPLWVFRVFGMLPEQDPFALGPDGDFYGPLRVDYCFSCYPDLYGYKFIYGTGYKELNILFFSRVMILLLLVVATAYLFELCKRYYGRETAAIVAILFATNPNVLAHARLVTPDMAAACFNLVSFYYFLSFLEERSLKNGALAGTGLALALLSKASNVYLLALYPVLFMIDCIRKANKSQRSCIKPLLVMALVLIIALNAGYMFQRLGKEDLREIFADKEPFSVSVARRLTFDWTIPVSTYYVSHFIGLEDHIGRQHENYLYQSVNVTHIPAKKTFAFPEDGIAWNAQHIMPKALVYWLLVLLIKTPEASIGLTLLTLAYYVLSWAGYLSDPYRGDKGLKGNLVLALAVPAVLILNINILIGVRLILFTFPFIFLLFARPIRHMLDKKGMARTLVYALVALSVLPSLVYHPHYLAYFNMFIGGPANGHMYLSDSNIDWGQDLPGLRAYMDENGIHKVKLAYFGRGKIDEYGIEYDPLPNNQRYLPTQRPDNMGCGPTTGLLAVSVTSLTGQYGDPGCYGWLADRSPDATIGYSIRIYDITEPVYATGQGIPPAFVFLNASYDPDSDTHDINFKLGEGVYTMSSLNGHLKPWTRIWDTVDRSAEFDPRIKVTECDEGFREYSWLYYGDVLTVRSNASMKGLALLTESLSKRYPPKADLLADPVRIYGPPEGFTFMEAETDPAESLFVDRFMFEGREYYVVLSGKPIRDWKIIYDNGGVTSSFDGWAYKTRLAHDGSTMYSWMHGETVVNIASPNDDDGLSRLATHMRDRFMPTRDIMGSFPLIGGHPEGYDYVNLTNRWQEGLYTVEYNKGGESLFLAVSERPVRDFLILLSSNATSSELGEQVYSAYLPQQGLWVYSWEHKGLVITATARERSEDLKALASFFAKKLPPTSDLMEKHGIAYGLPPGMVLLDGENKPDEGLYEIRYRYRDKIYYFVVSEDPLRDFKMLLAAEAKPSPLGDGIYGGHLGDPGLWSNTWRHGDKVLTLGSHSGGPDLDELAAYFIREYPPEPNPIGSLVIDSGIPSGFKLLDIEEDRKARLIQAGYMGFGRPFHLVLSSDKHRDRMILAENGAKPSRFDEKVYGAYLAEEGVWVYSWAHGDNVISAVSEKDDRNLAFFALHFINSHPPTEDIMADQGSGKTS